MDNEHQQTILGIVCLTAVFVVALAEGFNGRVTATYAIALLAMVSPKVLRDILPNLR